MMLWKSTRYDAPTRERVARSILELGPSTAAVLAERLDLTPAAVRRHLDHLIAEGAVEAREPRVYGTRGRGRPAKVFAITEAGRDRFVQQYDDLAVQALRFMAETGGDDAVLAFARRRVAGISSTTTRSSPRSPDWSRRRRSPGRSPRAATPRRSARGRSGSSSASSTARSRTWPTSSPSSARRRPRSSPRSSAGTSSAWPPSPTATGSAPPASRARPHERVTS